MRVIAIIETKEGFFQSMDAYPDTKEGKRQAEKHFLELVSNDIYSTAVIPGTDRHPTREEAKEEAKRWSDDRTYDVGDTKITMVTEGCIFHNDA